jgi:drug/metabolite transporter (DMT)-like permease
MQVQKARPSHYLTFALGLFFVGSSVVSGKQLTNTLPVFFTMGIRFVVSLIFFFVLMKMRHEKFPKLNRRDLVVLFIQSATGIFLFNIFLFYGLRYTSGTEAGVLLSLSPAFSALIAFVFLREKLNAKIWLGIGLAMLGIALINITGQSASVTADTWLHIAGILMIGGVALSEAIFMVTGKYNTAKLSPYQISFAIICIAFVLFLPFALYEAWQVDYMVFDLRLLVALAYYVVFVGIVPYMLVYAAMRFLSATSAGVLTGVIPISSVLLSILFLGERIQFLFVIGALISIIGMVITAREFN